MPINKAVNAINPPTIFLLIFDHPSTLFFIEFKITPKSSEFLPPLNCPFVE